MKYPFSGVAPNLIDKFLVLGYEQKVIENTFRYLRNEDEENIFKIFNFEERPTIMNEICNDYCKYIYDNDIILELIFPNLTKMYF